MAKSQAKTPNPKVSPIEGSRIRMVEYHRLAAGGAVRYSNRILAAMPDDDQLYTVALSGTGRYGPVTTPPVLGPLVAGLLRDARQDFRGLGATISNLLWSSTEEAALVETRSRVTTSWLVGPDGTLEPVAFEVSLQIDEWFEILGLTYRAGPVPAWSSAWSRRRPAGVRFSDVTITKDPDGSRQLMLIQLAGRLEPQFAGYLAAFWNRQLTAWPPARVR